MNKAEFKQAVLKALDDAGFHNGMTRSQGRNVGYTFRPGYRWSQAEGKDKTIELRYLRSRVHDNNFLYELRQYARALAGKFATRLVERYEGSGDHQESLSYLQVWPLGEPEPPAPPAPELRYRYASVLPPHNSAMYYSPLETRAVIVPAGEDETFVAFVDVRQGQAYDLKAPSQVLRHYRLTLQGDRLRLTEEPAGEAAPPPTARQVEMAAIEAARAAARARGLVPYAEMLEQLGLTSHQEYAVAEEHGILKRVELPPPIKGDVWLEPRGPLTEEERALLGREVLLTKGQAAERLGISVYKFDKLRKAAGLSHADTYSGEGGWPGYLYRQSDVDALVTETKPKVRQP